MNQNGDKLIVGRKYRCTFTNKYNSTIYEGVGIVRELKDGLYFFFNVTDKDTGESNGLSNDTQYEKEYKRFYYLATDDSAEYFHLLEKYYPNTQVFKRLYPNGKEEKGFWVVEC